MQCRSIKIYPSSFEFLKNDIFCFDGSISCNYSEIKNFLLSGTSNLFSGEAINTINNFVFENLEIQNNQLLSTSDSIEFLNLSFLNTDFLNSQDLLISKCKNLSSLTKIEANDVQTTSLENVNFSLIENTGKNNILDINYSINYLSSYTFWYPTTGGAFSLNYFINKNILYWPGYNILLINFDDYWFLLPEIDSDPTLTLTIEKIHDIKGNPIHTWTDYSTSNANFSLEIGQNKTFVPNSNFPYNQESHNGLVSIYGVKINVF